jgi:pimeloyl-ACP methyl ester carboxylesterase
VEPSIPTTRYAKNGDVHLAYQILGEGATDLVYLPGIFTHLEHQWEEPSFARFLRRLASFSRLILMDPRGIGLSDQAPELPLMEEQMDDVRAVLDAAGSSRAILLGVSQGGPMAILFAATHPERTAGLILYGSYPTPVRDEDYPWGRTVAWQDEWARQIDEQWGTGRFLPQMAPTMAGDERFRTWWARMERLAAGPGNALAYVRRQMGTDVRAALPAIRVPTLVLQRQDDSFRDAGNGRYLASRIPGARLVELAGVDHLPYVGDADEVLGAIEEFVTGARGEPPGDRVLATLLFTDIVDSTKVAAELGDAKWREVLERHHAAIRRELDRFRGREIDTAGDGFFAMFDGPARAVRCAMAARDAVRELGVEVRAGLHTGEVELSGSKASGLAVHIGARIGALAGAGEVLVSGTVKDLVVGSGIEFEPRGEHELKGVPGSWPLFAVRAP